MRLNALDREAQPLWGRMNVEQMLSHLVQTADWPFGHSVPDRSNLISRTILKQHKFMTALAEGQEKS